jgi:TolB-like protein/tetratricopeptide (TPR) repeat protein
MAKETRADAAPDASVFVSYARKDQKKARLIVSAIEEAGYTVWWDDALAPGERFSDHIKGALDGALAVVVLWSETSIGSHWVLDEAAHGRDRNRLVPLSIDGSEPPLGFGQLHTLSINPLRKSDPGFAALLAALAALMAREAPVPAAPARPARISRRGALAGGAAVLAATAVAAVWRLRQAGTDDTGSGIAVLPFANLSADKDSTYFSDGLAAEIRSQLAANPLLAVAAQTSSNHFRDSKDDARAISSALGVAYLLEGDVSRSADKVRVSVSLISGHTGLSRWAQPFERPLTDIFAVQSEIARIVASALTAQMAAGSPTGKTADIGGTTNFAAYDAYLRGKDQYEHASDAAGDALALASFDRAIAADPNYALAHAARARSLTVIGNQYDQGRERRDRYDEAVAAARHAVALAPGLARAQAALGFALFESRVDARAAREPYEASYRLGHGDADVLSGYSLFEARCGRFDQARAAIGRALELDPINAHSYWLRGEIEFCARNWTAAIAPIERALSLNPQLSVAHYLIGSTRLLLGDLADAAAQYAMEPSSLFRLTGLAIVCHHQGKPDEAEHNRAALAAQHGDNSLYQQAQIMAQWGRIDDGLTLLEAARSEGDAGLVYLRNDPFVDPLRQQPRFIRLLDALGFA